MAQVTLRALCFVAAKRAELVGIQEANVEIADGEFAVLAGPAGSGKSTLLRLIAGLEKPASGDVLIGDRKVNEVLPKDREVAMVFRNYALFPHLSVYDNVAFGLKVRKFPGAEIKKRVQEAAAILGLENLLTRKPAGLTNEESLRVALGRALVRQAKVFLLDQPLALLEPAARERMRLEIARLQQRLETTMICSIEDPMEAMSLGDRIIVLRDGVVQQSDTPTAIYAGPANLFVAEFMGNPPMNLIRGTLKQERDTLLFRERDEGTIEFRIPTTTARAFLQEFAGRGVVLGIRPEDISLTQNPPSKSETAANFPALLEVVQARGAETILHLQTGAHALVSRSDGALDRRDAGRRVRCTFSPACAHFFDTETTHRIK
ncbi:MAG: ABC transporter ATP-binding protein [Chthoniobacterales bacterium]